MELSDKQINKQKYNNKYYGKNKEIVLKKLKEKVRCETCDCEFNRSGISKHNKTKKHLYNLLEFKKKV